VLGFYFFQGLLEQPAQVGKQVLIHAFMLALLAMLGGFDFTYGGA
jgi:hypothetical protein